jgi:3-hydroxyacyl-CoA dehydrogenase
MVDSNEFELVSEELLTVVKVLEIMGHKDTDSVHIELLMERSREHGFNPFHVKKDSLGYIYNR